MNEKQIQENLLRNLCFRGWKFRDDIKNINDIENNFFKCVELRNKTILSEASIDALSNFEKERLISYITKESNISESRDILLDEKISLNLDNGKNIYLNIFDLKNHDKNIFEIAKEVTMKIDSKRMDILLLINGIPISNIELKSELVTYKDAVRQLKEYSLRYTSLLKFIQILIASNNSETVYFANNSKINDEYIFNFSDFENNNIKELSSFSRQFLNPYFFHRYVSNFIINKRNDKLIIATRGYQVHAIEAIIKRLNNPSISNNGFIWHATGSGKTITSFLSAQMITDHLDKYKKVIFLVDRTELDSQTYNEYNSFLPSYDQVPEINNTNQLYNSLLNSKNKLIVTTIHKMSKLVSSNYKNYSKLVAKMRCEDIVIIFDEGHRTQSGNMHNEIKKAFPRASLIGFTGTPIFNEEINEVKSLKLTTEQIFTKNLHSYLLKNAIDDGNILPFYMQYYENEKKILDINISKYLESDSFITRVSNNILNNFEHRSNNRMFSSILVATNIATAIKFYEKLKKLQSRLNKNNNYKKINISITYSLEQNYHTDTLDKLKAYEEAVKDFNKITDSRESVNNPIGQKQYQSRLQSILKDTKHPKINLVIVVDRLLTGFDAKRMNTIYVAKDLKLHNLIQAFSRTNRLFDQEKKSGNVISFVPNLEEHVNKAIRIYSKQENANSIFIKNLEDFLKKIDEIQEKLISLNYENIIKTPIKNFKEGKKYINCVSKLVDIYRHIKIMDGFKDSEASKELNDDYINQLANRARHIKNTSKEISFEKEIKINPYDSIDVPLNLISDYVIDGKYIRNILFSAQIENEKGNNDNADKILSEFIKKYQSQNKSMNIFLERLKLCLSETKELNIKKFLKKQICDINTELYEKYKLLEEDIKSGIKNLKFYGNIIFMNKIENKLNELYLNIKKYAERVLRKKEAMKDIKDKIEFNIISEDILNEK